MTILGTAAVLTREDMTVLDNLLGEVIAHIESLAPLRQVAWLSSLRERQKHRRTTMTKDLGVSTDAVGVALFLASGESAYVTGIDLAVDAGMKVW